jgi:hypothetical protein
VPHYALVIERKEIGIRRTVVAVAGTNSQKMHRATWPFVYTT